MKVYITRHGQDDDSVRGGWSNTSLTKLGIEQAKNLANCICNNTDKYNIGKIFCSDLLRAKETAEIIISKANSIPIKYEHNLREINNGVLAGMDNKIANMKYPNLYYRNLDWNQQYPQGESPCQFYNRICTYFYKFIEENKNYDKNILIITHGGVINIIRTIVDNEIYSNKNKFSSIPCCSMDFFIKL